MNINSIINNNSNKTYKYFTIINDNKDSKFNGYIEEIDPRERKPKSYYQHIAKDNNKPEIMDFDDEYVLKNNSKEDRTVSQVSDFLEEEHNVLQESIDKVNENLKEEEYLYYEIYGLGSYNQSDALENAEYHWKQEQLNKYKEKWKEEYRKQVRDKLISQHGMNVSIDNLSMDEFMKYIIDNNIQPSYIEYLNNKYKSMKKKNQDADSLIALYMMLDTVLRESTYKNYVNGLSENIDFNEKSYNPFDFGDDYYSETGEPLPLVKSIFESDLFNYLTDDEKKAMYYIYNKQGADEFVKLWNDYFEDTLNKRVAMQRANDFINSITVEDIMHLEYIETIKERMKHDFDRYSENPLKGKTEEEFLPRNLAPGEETSPLVEFFCFMQTPAIDNLSDEDKKVIYYIYNTEGMDKVKEVYSNYDIGLIDKIWDTGIEGLGNGLKSFVQGFREFWEMDGKKTIDQYEAAYIMMYLQEHEKLLQGEYEIATSIGNMLPLVALSTVLSCAGVPGVVPETISSVLMGVSSAGNAMESAYQEGHGKAESIIYGVISGISEGGLEYLLGGIWGIAKPNGASGKIVGKNILMFLSDMFSEGVEESTQEIIDSVLKLICFDEDLQLDLNAIAKSGFYGFITAGIMNGGSMVVNGVAVDVFSLIKNTQLIRKINKLEQVGVNIDYSKLNDSKYQEDIMNMSDISNNDKVISNRIDTNVDTEISTNTNINTDTSITTNADKSTEISKDIDETTGAKGTTNNRITIDIEDIKNNPNLDLTELREKTGVYDNDDYLCAIIKREYEMYANIELYFGTPLLNENADFMLQQILNGHLLTQEETSDLFLNKQMRERKTYYNDMKDKVYNGTITTEEFARWFGQILKDESPKNIEQIKHTLETLNYNTLDSNMKKMYDGLSMYLQKHELLAIIDIVVMDSNTKEMLRKLVNVGDINKDDLIQFIRKKKSAEYINYTDEQILYKY